MRTVLRIFGILIVLAIMATSGYFIYRAFFATPETTTPITTTTTDIAPEPTTTTPETSPQVFSRNKTLAYWINEKTSAIYYATPEGKVFKLFGAEREEEVSTQTLDGLHSITPSPDGTKALAEFGYPFESVFAIFDTEKDGWERLPQGTVAADFDPVSKQIVYAVNGAAGSLRILNLADKKSSVMMPIAANDAVLSWMKTDKIYLQQRPTSAAALELWSINPIKKTIEEVNLLGSSLDAVAIKWFKKSGLGLKLSAPDVNATAFSLLHTSGAELLDLPFQTLPEKCVFADNKALYCAIPTSLPPRINLPDDYLKRKIYTTDSIISYNLETQEEKVLFTGDIDAINLNILSNQLFFVNRYDEKIYSLELVK